MSGDVLLYIETTVTLRFPNPRQLGTLYFLQEKQFSDAKLILSLKCCSIFSRNNNVNRENNTGSYDINRVEGRLEKAINLLQDQLFGEKSFLKDIEQDTYNQVRLSRSGLPTSYLWSPVHPYS